MLLVSFQMPDMRLLGNLSLFLLAHLVQLEFFLGKIRKKESCYSVIGCIISPPSLLPTFSELAIILIWAWT